MDNKEFIEKAIDMVIEYYNSKVELSYYNQINEMDVNMIRFDNSLGNYEAFFSVNYNDELYYNVVYNMRDDKFYFHVYQKLDYQEYTNRDDIL